uniref:Candidate secreted effector n=1 Tax=Meloidogyne incognita TaxID=6306 RepID=A0A914LJ42_MELIC
MVTSSIIYTTFSIYFLFSQLVTVSQCAPSPVVAYSPPSTPHNINTVISTQKLQKCPPCPKDTSLSDTNKALVSKLRCPPQIGNCTANNALAKPTTGALKGRGERCCCCDCCCCRPCCCCCCKPCCCCCCKPCCCCCCRPCCCCCRPCCCCCCRPCCCCNCCGCKRHRRNGCNATTMKMVDVLPTPPILMKMKGQ